MTSIYDNKVTLSVEDKPIARGELVIVNDRYGVKIDEVIAKSSKNKSEVSEENEVQEQDEFNEMSSDDEFDNSADMHF